MACRTLYATLGIPAAMAAGIVSTIRIPTGPCVPYMQPTHSAMVSFPLAPGVVPISTMATRPLDASAPPSVNGQDSSSFATASGSTSNDYVFQVKPQTSLTSRGVDNGTAYVGAGGKETSVCGQAKIFTMQGNTLSNDGFWVSATSKTSWTRFAVSAPIGEMVTNFTLADGYLTWLNQAFDGGFADFCAINKTVLAVYNGTAPTDCEPVKLLAIQTMSALCNDTTAAAATASTANSLGSLAPFSSTLQDAPATFESASSITITPSSAYETSSPLFSSPMSSGSDISRSMIPGSQSAKSSLYTSGASSKTTSTSPMVSGSISMPTDKSSSSLEATSSPTPISTTTTAQALISSATVTALSANFPSSSSTNSTSNSHTVPTSTSASGLASLSPPSSIGAGSIATQASGLSTTGLNTISPNTSPSVKSSSTSSSSTTSLSTSNSSTLSSSTLDSSTPSSNTPSAATSTSITSSLSSTPTNQSTSSTSAPPLTSSPSSVAAPTSQAAATSSPTSIYTYTTGVRLSHPTPLIANAVDSIQYDDVATNVSVNFPIQLYDQRARNFTVTTNGLFAVGFADIADNTINTALYASALPPGTVCVFWKDLVAGPTAQQGIYYQIDVYGANSQLSVEYILSSYVDPTNSTNSTTQLYHAILVYDYDAFGLVELYYFSDGDGGADATIGVQGFDTNHDPQAAQYEYNTTVAAGDLIDLVTDLNDNPNGTATLRYFTVNCYGPGTFPVGTCH